MNSHGRPFKCSVDDCSSSFIRESDLRRHDQSVHKRDKKFWCTVSACVQKDVGFARRDHFIQHLTTHSSSTAPDAIPGASALTNPMRKRRRRSSDAEDQEIKHELKTADELLVLRAENEELKLREQRLQDTIHIQAGSIQALLSRMR